MGRATLISAEEYLNTVYEDGDREYVDGRIVERNVGEIDHASLQGAIYRYLWGRYGKGFWSAVELRVQVSRDRFRVPDICVIEGSRPGGTVITAPPFLVIEVLSREDRADDIEEKIADYLAFGIRYVWVVNPRTRRGYVHTPEGSHEAKDGVLRTANPEIEVPLREVLE